MGAFTSRITDTPAPSTPRAFSCSVVVPVYNEVHLIRASIARMLTDFRRLRAPFEILICENGSTDGTSVVAQQLHREHPEVRVEHMTTPNYGLALKHAIGMCRYEVILLLNIDFWSIDFVQAALARLGRYDLVIGSKTMRGARDERPLIRRVITRSFNWFLRQTFGFCGTDTHGLKAFRRQPFSAIVSRCVTDRSLFDTELVLRAEREGLRMTEVPVHVRELRQLSYGALIKRAPETLWNLLCLWIALRRRDSEPLPS